MLTPYIPEFKQNLIDLWANPTAASTIFQTGDLIQTLWQNAVVTGYEITPCLVLPSATYVGLAPLAPGSVGTEASAAACFEAACFQMVQTTLFTIVAPPFTTPPPIPAGVSLPGLLTTLFTSIFVSGNEAKINFPTAPLVADAIVAYLQSWAILVTIIPAAAVIVPIV